MQRAGKDEQPRFALKPECVSVRASHAKGPRPLSQGHRSESAERFFAAFNVKHVLCSLVWLPGMTRGNEAVLGLSSLFPVWGGFS